MAGGRQKESLCVYSNGMRAHFSRQVNGSPFVQFKSTDSPIQRIFGGKFRSTLKAQFQRESVTIEDWRSLRLDIQVCYIVTSCLTNAQLTLP